MYHIQSKFRLFKPIFDQEMPIYLQIWLRFVSKSIAYITLLLTITLIHVFYLQEFFITCEQASILTANTLFQNIHGGSTRSLVPHVVYMYLLVRNASICFTFVRYIYMVAQFTIMTCFRMTEWE